MTHTAMTRALSLASFVAAALAAQAADTAPFALAATRHTTEWTITHRGRTLMVYAFHPQMFKPYVKELATLDGVNILRDAPSDHLHHHALMYGIRVNGLNFWEETPGCGIEKVIQTPEPEIGVGPQGRSQVRLRQTLHWVAPQDAFLPDSPKVALLVEQRTLTLTVDEAQKEVALQWKSEFTVGERTNQVTLSGANYHGLGMRFLEDLDPVALHRLASGQPDLSGNKQDVSAQKWGSVAFDQPAQSTTVALFGHPSNARGDSVFFSMKTPFAYLSATQGLDKQPLTYRAGESFALNYLVAVYPEFKSPEALRARSQQWEATKP
jgi:hypothetical protein